MGRSFPSPRQETFFQNPQKSCPNTPKKKVMRQNRSKNHQKTIKKTQKNETPKKQNYPPLKNAKMFPAVLFCDRIFCGKHD